MAKFKIEDQVRVVTPVISGGVQARRFNDEADEMEYLVEYPESDDENHTRWFLESQLESVNG